MTAKINNLKPLWKGIHTAEIHFSTSVRNVRPQRRRDDNIKPDLKKKNKLDGGTGVHEL